METIEIEEWLNKHSENIKVILKELNNSNNTKDLVVIKDKKKWIYNHIIKTKRIKRKWFKNHF